MTDLSPRMEKAFEITKNVCFGRLVLTIPATAKVYYGPATASSQTFRYPGESHKLAEHIAKRLKEIEEEKIYISFTDKVAFLGKDSLYGKVLNGALPEQRLVFGHSQGIFYKIHSFTPIGEDLYVQFDTAPPHPNEAEMKMGWAVEPVMRDLNTTARHMRPRAEDEVPTEPGFCIEGAFIAENPALTHESVTVGIRLKEFPDIHFSIEAGKNQGYLVESNALEPRLKRFEALSWQINPLWASQIRTLRSGQRKLGAWEGFEQLDHLPADDSDADKYEFGFVSLGHPTDPLQPNLDVQLKSGVQDNRSGRVRPSLSEEEAVALWDKLIGSIRVRPTGAKTSAAPPSRPPLGTQQVTGYPCPQTGLWECADVLSLAQPRRIWLEQGQSVPLARVWKQPTWWQRLKGERPVGTQGAMWRLAAYERPADAPAAAPLPPGTPDASSHDGQDTLPPAQG